MHRLWRGTFAAWHGNKAVIESSIDGPEIEANMVIIDGGLIFAEINDDFPSPGDSDMASKFANFFEDSNMIPSRLPQRELVTAVPHQGRFRDRCLPHQGPAAAFRLPLRSHLGQRHGVGSQAGCSG